MQDLIVSYYDREAATLAPRYEALDPEAVYAAAIGLLPSVPSRVLDVASGSGRDAAWLRGMGHSVTAVEPSAAMREQARRLHPGDGIDWIDSRLPHLEGVERPQGGFGFILAAAVWMHLEDDERQAAWNALARLAAPGAHAVLLLRHGPWEAERPMFPIEPTAELARAMEAGFSCARILPEARSDDLLGRGAVTWQTLAARR